MAHSLLPPRAFIQEARVSLTSLTFLTFHQVRGCRKARSIFGWTPGLRRVMGSQLLSCGCLVGMYEVWNGEVVAVIDDPAPHCPMQHEAHLVVAAP